MRSMAFFPLALLVLSLASRAWAIGVANKGNKWAGLALNGGAGHLGGACGFTRPFPPNSIFVAGVSPRIGGLNSTCGRCFELECVNSPNCIKGAKVKVTVTNHCAYGKGINGGPCRRGAFSLQPEAFQRLSKNPNMGMLSATYKAVPCQYTGGVQAMVIVGNNYVLQVLFQNVGGTGNLQKVEVQAGSGPFQPMRLNYGSVWETTRQLVISRRHLNFRLTARDGKTLLVNRAIPARFKPMFVYRTRAQFA